MARGLTAERVHRAAGPSVVGMTPDLLHRPTLLVVVAHPDDEAFGCGSVIASASAHGLRTVVACATRGELGEPSP